MTWRLTVAIGAVVILVAAPAAGQEAAPRPRFSLRVDAQWIGAAVRVALSDSWLNPGNRAMRVPQTTWLGELRVDTRLDAGSRCRIVFRPRVRGLVETTAADSQPADRQQRAILEITEAYLTCRPADAVAVTYGLQNFQWGPAELMGPSNRLFHEVGVFRDPLYVIRGKHLIRLNLSAGRQWSVVGLAELGATDEAPFRSGAPFRRAGQAKVEYTTATGAAYFGVTFGARGGEPPWSGGYASVSITDSVSAYVDGSVQQGSQAWYPVARADGRTGFAINQQTKGLRTLALAGLRYTFSAAFDARVEYLRQDAGYTQAQVGAAPLAVAQQGTSESVEQWLRPGLEFLGRNLVLVSVLSRDLPPADRLDLQFRYVRSSTDGSGAGFLTASLDAGDALVVFGSFTLTHGPELAEFTRLARAGAVAGFIWSW